MATKAKTVETELQNRLRIDTAEKAISDANLFSIMNYTQRTINYAFKRYLTTDTFTAAATNNCLSYTSTSIAADCYAVLSVYESTRSLMVIPNWNQLQQYDSSWRTQGASRSEAWSLIGRNMIAVYPASSQTYDIVYLRETTTINSSADLFNIPDQDITLLEDLCELVWLAHLRHYPEAMLKSKRLLETITAMQGGRLGRNP